MNYEEFKERLKRDLWKELTTKLGPVEITENVVAKLQNEKYDALTVLVKGEHIGLNINVNNQFQSYEEGAVSFDEIVGNIITMVENRHVEMPDYNIALYRHYENVKDRLTLQIVSKEINEEMLREIPHKEIEDLAIVYRLMVPTKDKGSASILITNQLLSNYNLSLEQLHADAMKYCPANNPVDICSMYEMMKRLIEDDSVLELLDGDDRMFVARVKGNEYGASVIAYPQFMNQAAELLQGDFYVIPSSIFEVILVKDDGSFNVNFLRSMVQDVNTTQLSPEEKLSDNVYHYDSKERVFELAEKFKTRQEEKVERPKGRFSVRATLQDIKEEQAERSDQGKQHAEPGKEEVSR